MKQYTVIFTPRALRQLAGLYSVVGKYGDKSTGIFIWRLAFRDVQCRPYYRLLSNTYIADRSGEARAENFTGRIVAACQSLSTFPERGSKRDDIRPNLRTKGYAKSVTIAFSVNAAADAVAIHGVFYGGQDFEQVLRDTDSDD